jgi:phage terminase large subunit-like protein
VAVKIDINDSIQPCKTGNQRKRIDGFAAMLNAYVVYNDHKDDYMNLIKG